MMELTCALILISASLVLATPSGYGGYGVKGGASARAESSASAGAFPGIPVAVPLGAGYSGSFSKSASSSSASSSASSSSSSSSFSYSGSGTGGFGLHEGAPGHGGCSSGNCPNARGNEEPALHGSSAQGYNPANAAASAEAAAGAVSGSGCQGSSCDSNSEKCTSGSCKTRTTTINSDSNKCTSSQCGSASESGASPTDHDSNDIHVVTDSAHNANHQSSSYHQRPSTHLETPKEISKCKSGNCNTVPGEPGHQSSPSSYHVPIHGAYDSDVPKPPTNHVTGGPSGSVRPGNDNFGHSPSHAPVAPVHIGYGKPSDANNKLPNDKLPPYTGGFGGPAGILSLNDIPVTVNPNPANTPQDGKPISSTPTGCNSPSCSGSGPTAGLTPTGTYNHRPDGDIPSDKLPTYTGGFGAPAGTLKPSGFDIHGTVTTKPTGGYSPTTGATSEATAPYGPSGVTKPIRDVSTAAPNQPQYTGGFGGPPGTLKPGEHNSPGCNGGNCVNYPISGSSAGANANAQSGSFGVSKPHSDAAPNQPQYIGGFGGPPGTLKPGEHNSPGCNGGNCANFALSGPSAGANAQPGSFGVIKPHSDAAPNQSQYTDGFGGPPGTLKPGEHNSPGCNGGNCANYPISGPSAGANAQPGLFGVTKPHLDAAPNQPQYTGGFGGPPGTLKPGEHNSPGCNGGNCANYPISGPSAGANAQPGLFGVTKPHSDAGPNQSQYTDGFGGPPGTLKPGEHNSPGCNGGNCANYPISGPSAGANAQPGLFGVTKPHLDAAPNQPQYTGGFGGPPGTLKPGEHNSPGCNGGNCVNYPISGPSAAGAGANAQLGSYGITKPSDENNPSNEKPNYTGGFGGPAGLLKPNDYTVPVVSPTPLNKPLGSVPLAHIVASGGAHATAAAAADANAVAYPGDFGGSPGVLAPFDDGKIETLPAHGSHNAHIHSQHGIIPGAYGGATELAGAHGNTGAQAGSPVGAASYAGAAAGATAGAYGYNPHGSYNHAGSVKGGSPCGGGCGRSGGDGKDGGSALEFGAGPGFPKLGLSGGGITFGSAGKSLAGGNAFGLGGSFGSSSASAQSFAGAFTKGGYGKR